MAGCSWVYWRLEWFSPHWSGYSHAAPNTELIQKRRLNQDVEMANRFKEMIVPEQIPVLPGWSIALKFHTSLPLRTEFHDLMLLPDGKLMVVCGKIEGNGMVCLFNIATLRAALRTLAVLRLPRLK